MIELFAELCLAERPEVCVERLLPGPAPCVAAAAATWAASRPWLILKAARCAELGEVVKGHEVTELAPGVFAHMGEVAVPGPGNAGDTANLGFVLGEAAVAVIDAGGRGRWPSGSTRRCGRGRTCRSAGWC